MSNKLPIILLLTFLSIFFNLEARNWFRISVQPNVVTLAPSQQQQFSLSRFAPALAWSVQPAGMGTISSTGLYTAPSSFENNVPVTIVAMAIDNPSESFSATVWLEQPALASPVVSNVSISINSGPTTLFAGQS